jgi:hypothetical protein
VIDAGAAYVLFSSNTAPTITAASGVTRTARQHRKQLDDRDGDRRYCGDVGGEPDGDGDKRQSVKWRDDLKYRQYSGDGDRRYSRGERRNERNLCALQVSDGTATATATLNTNSR